MNYTSINIQGNIFSSEILEKIRTEDIRFQTAKDFNLDPRTSVRDEISLSWSLALSHWKAFQQKREKLSSSDTGTSETRTYWMKPLMGILGYDLSIANAEILNGKTYAISFRSNNLDQFPVHLVGINQSLDARAESGGPRLSPHALIQEYLNNKEHTYGLVSNGKFLRLLRDATRLSRLSYIEFNLEEMMEENLYAEFALLYRFLHGSRMPQKIDVGPECILEFYHQEALASGSRIRERLSAAVEISIKELANGFLQNHANQGLRKAIASNQLDAPEYYLYNLRIIYRLLFLMVIEERKLIYPAERNETLERQRSIYHNYYSVQRLCKLVEKKVYVDPKKTDIWQSLVTCFALFEQSRYGTQLGISPLGSGLFAPDALGIMGEQVLDNETILKVLSHLITFESENGQRVRVNYADLDVEEFGSVYEGLLEYDPQFFEPATQPIFIFKAGNERSKSGSHYTPEELVKPLIQHSLDYLIADKLKEKEPESALLSLKVCDVACGSGHILLSAARRIGFELAKLRSKEDQPAPSVLRHAIRDVINHCIYGVDKNPLAVELCKVAMWLEAHNPGEPLNFLNHRIKCGDAIVGLAHRSELENGIADEAFKTLPGDDKDIAKIYRDKNVKERKERIAKSVQLKAEFEKTTENSVQEAMAEYKTFNHLPETTPEEIERKAKAYKKFIDGKGFTFIKAMADTQVAQFFMPKTDANKDSVMTDGDFRLILSGYKGWQDRKVAKATAIALENRFFHWFIEFPEVFNEGGFDCDLGNPPFLGGKKISSSFGDNYLNFIKANYEPSSGGLDFVVYFFRRIFAIIRDKGFQSLISTNTIAQGDSRIGGLEYILNNNGSINYAVKSMKWPGLAAVEVSLITINKSRMNLQIWLNNKPVDVINSYLENSENTLSAQILLSSSNLGFMGSNVLGSGFILDFEVSDKLIINNSKNSNVIYAFLNADDINNSPSQTPSRNIINFANWSLEFCEKEYPDCIEILHKKVKPERDKVNRATYRENWWHYAEKGINLYKAIKPLKRYLVVPFTTKYLTFTFKSGNLIISHAGGAIAFEEYKSFSLISNTFHEQWAWLQSSTMGGSTLRYTPSSALATFPFPQNLNPQQEQQLETIGEAYHEHRRQLMLGMQLGLTKTYNLFHSNAITVQNINDKDKQVLALQKHLEKNANVISFKEAIDGILKLRELHIQMDTAVLDSYGWNDILLHHDFYEVDYLPKNDRVRFTIHPDARKEMLKRLLELNHKIHEEEVKAGLWDKKITNKKKSKPDELNEKQEEYGLFKQE